ncbi:MAG TPA: SurA N-terminal domain-containing protein [Steroidobacteraceae bacterium]|jgi:peptidyl-prolyl cis-trans isomerase D|nr:SurA N-terminal domain-containing protein [Steroidobacteraceae bacterium]
MLQTIHDKLKGWLAGVVLGIIGLVFVFWGINWTLSAPTYAAKVNGVEISGNEVREAYQRRLAQYERQSNAPLDDAQRAGIKKQVLDDYISGEALVTRADRLGYRVSDQQLLAEMAQYPALQVDGKFDYAHALAVLKAQGRSVTQIENSFRRDVKLKQLDRAIDESSFATASEVKRFLELTRQQRELAWLTLSAAKYAVDATPDEPQIKAYYEAHKAQYMTPETVHLRYVELSLAGLAAKVNVDDAQLKAYYEEQKTKSPERYVQPEQRRVAHILLQVPDPKDDAAVKAKAESILKRAESGEDFGKLAQEFSQDPGSAQKGGDLGWADRKAYVAPFADAAFSMKEGEIRGPVKTQFGYHILKLEGVQPTTIKTFDQAKTDLATEYRQNEAERMFNDAQDQLADATLQNTSDIDVVAKKAGLEVHDIPNFSRNDGELGKSPAVLQAAFSEDVLDGHLSPIVELEKGRGVVLSATDHVLPKQKPLEAVRAEVVAAWKKERGTELAAQAAAAAVKRLNAGESWDSVAKSLGLTPEAPKFVARGDQAVPLSVRQAAFEGPKPKGAPVYSNLPLSDGDAAVVAVSAVREEPTADPKVGYAEAQREFAQQAASADAMSYEAAVRADSKVTVNLQALD